MPRRLQHHHTLLPAPSKTQSLLARLLPWTVGASVLVVWIRILHLLAVLLLSLQLGAQGHFGLDSRGGLPVFVGRNVFGGESNRGSLAAEHRYDMKDK